MNNAIIVYWSGLQSSVSAVCTGSYRCSKSDCISKLHASIALSMFHFQSLAWRCFNLDSLLRRRSISQGDRFDKFRPKWLRLVAGGREDDRLHGFSLRSCMKLTHSTTLQCTTKHNNDLPDLTTRDQQARNHYIFIWNIKIEPTWSPKNC